jgi:hypothetical protein
VGETGLITAVQTYIGEIDKALAAARELQTL